MKKAIAINKQVLKTGLYVKFLIRIYETWKATPSNSYNEYLQFKQFTQSICRSFSIEKHEAFDILRIFQELGFIEIIKWGKIKINYKVVEK